MPGWTNNALYAILGLWTRTTSPGTQMYLALIRSTPTSATATMADVTEITAGNGYTSGGQAINRNSTDWDVLTLDGPNNKAYAQLKDYQWTGTGGPLPSDSNGATFAVVTDDNATVSARKVFHYGSLGSARVVSDTQNLVIQNFEIDALHAA